MKRENDVLANFKNLHETRLQLAAKEAERINEAAAQRDSFTNNYHIIKDMKARKDRERSMLVEAARDDVLATVIKGIYIGALEAGTLTDDGLLLAESMVDGWIKENGGASAILSKVGNDTYLLSRITKIVEDAAEAEVQEIEDTDAEEIKAKKKAAESSAEVFINSADKDQIKKFVGDIIDKIGDKADKTEDEAKESEDAAADTNDAEVAAEPEKETETEVKDEEPHEEKKEDTSNDNDGSKDDTEVKDEAPAEEPAKEDKPEEKKEEAPVDDNPKDEDEEVDIEIDEDEPVEDKPTEGEEKAADAEADKETDDAEAEGEAEDNDDADALEDVDDTSDTEDIDDTSDADLNKASDDGADDQNLTVDGDLDNKGKVFDDLDKEEDVQKAIDLIRSRVADAEETFIRNNAEDKKKVDELINRISTNVKAIEDINGKNDTKEQIANESIRMDKRSIDSIRENRPLTVFEKMTRNLTSNIVTNEAVLSKYTNEDGSLDVELAVESAKVMYGFLETINTLKLDKVDSKYIENVLNNMH